VTMMSAVLRDINPVRNSQEIYYVCTTAPIRLIINEILGFLGDDYEECSLLECDAVWLL
jgi:hypothetical protein